MEFLRSTPVQLTELYPRFLSHNTLCFGAEGVTNFPGRPLPPLYQCEIIRDVCDLAVRS